jgi:5-methylcytosine-specific restriction endonuclease McrBC regulatory subunit McrC
MNPLRIKDNSEKAKTEFSGIKALTQKIADKPLLQLEKEGVFVFPELLKDAEDITKEQMILRSEGDNYSTGNVMGFIGCGDERLTIASRFCGDDEDYFLQYMLGRVFEFPNIVDLETDASQENTLFNFLLLLFPHYLKTAMRKGLFKEYIQHKYNDSNVKGTIDIPRHIRENPIFVGKIAYNQREFSYDNNLMELVRHTIEFIKTKRYGNVILTRVRDEVNAVVAVTERYELHNRQKVIDANKKKAVRHAYYREYSSLQRLCLLILRHQKHQIGFGSRQIYGILFDGAWLWEEYVNSLITEKFYHPRNKAGEGAQRLFDRDDSKIGLIYPDFISHNAENRIIADAKYKPLSNIGRHDYLQILAYMFRFDSKRGYYLYPESDGKEDETLQLNQGLTYEKNVSPRDDICVKKHGLRIPAGASSYNDFAEKMMTAENEFTKDIM